MPAWQKVKKTMKAKMDRNNEIVRLRDEEGRVFPWIADKLDLSVKNVCKIYYREKSKIANGKKEKEQK